MGDDAAREKGSQVLRDAVAGPTDSSVREHFNEIQRAASDPLSADRQANIQSAFAHTPSIQSTTSGSFPPPTPLASSRKRHRYAPESNVPPYPAGDYRPYSVPYESHPGYRSNRQRLEQYYPVDYGYSQPQPQPSQVASSPPQARIQGGAQITGNAEFDLFNCELLESDHEDHAEQFPQESHGDTF